MRQQGFAGIFVLLVLALAIAGGAYYLGTQKGSWKAQEATNTTSTTNQTADWKTYTNKRYGYSLKYPSDWHVWNIDRYVSSEEDRLVYVTFVEEPIGVVGLGGDPGGAKIVVGEKPIGLKPQGFVEQIVLPREKEFLGKDEPSFSKIKVRPGDIKGMDVTFVEGLGGSGLPVIAAFLVRDPQDSSVFEIYWDLLSEEEMQLFYDILSTFKFTSQ